MSSCFIKHICILNKPHVNALQFVFVGLHLSSIKQ